MIRHSARVIAAAALLLAGPGALGALAAPVELTILHTNDTHDHLEPFDSRQSRDVGGVARRATLFQRIKAKHPNVLVVDAGDVFQGTPLFTFFAGEPDYLTMAQAGYDAIAVGNHDLDNGLANLQKQAKHLNSPPLAATLVDPAGKTIFPAWELFERGGVKIAVIGIMGKNAYQAIADKSRKGISILDPAATLKVMIPQVRKHADVVIVLSHTGHEEEVALAREVPGIDLIVGGHSHTKVDRPVRVKSPDRETLVTQAFQWGEYVGRVDLVVDGKKVVKMEGGLLPVTTDIPPDPRIAATVAKYATQIAVQMKQVVGRTDFEFLNARKAEGDAPIGNLIADALRTLTGTEIGIMNSGGIRAPLPKGEVTRGMVFSMLPFDNSLVTGKVTGRVLQNILNFAASRSGRSGSLQVSGLSFVVDGGKATEVLVGGKPIDFGRTYSLTTIDYLAGGNDGATVFLEAGSYQETGMLVREAFVEYLKKTPLVTNPPGGRIRVKNPAPRQPAPAH